MFLQFNGATNLGRLTFAEHNNLPDEVAVCRVAIIMPLAQILQLRDMLNTVGSKLMTEPPSGSKN